MSNFYEDLHRADEVVGSSDRKLGLVFAGFFVVVGVVPLRSGHPVRIPALGAAAAFLSIALVFPSLLRPLNRFWTRLGVVLGKVVNPIVTALLFFLVFTPLGWLLRAMGKVGVKQAATDPATYWIPRQPPGPEPQTMTQQF